MTFCAARCLLEARSQMNAFRIPTDRVIASRNLSQPRFHQAEIRSRRASWTLPVMRASYRLPPGVVSTAKDSRAQLQELLLAHAPLVERMASCFARYGVDRDDLIQEGYGALLETARRLADVEGARFAAHAQFCMRLRMIRFVLDFHGPVHLPKSPLRGLEPHLGEPLEQWVTDSIPSYEELLVEAEQRQSQELDLQRALDSMTDPERLVIDALHLQNEPADASTLARSLGLSERRLRHLEARALGRLLTRPEANDPSAHVLVGGRRLRLHERQRPRRTRHRPVDVDAVQLPGLSAAERRRSAVNREAHQ